MAFSSIWAAVAGDILVFRHGLETLALEGLGTSLQPNFLRSTFQLPFDFIIFSKSCFMLKYSFSSSATLSFMLSKAATGFCGVLPSFLIRGRFAFRFCEFSTLSEAKNQPATDVRSFSCSKNKTCTTTRSGNLSF